MIKSGKPQPGSIDGGIRPSDDSGAAPGPDLTDPESVREFLEAQGYSITRPPSSSLLAAFDPVALWHELNGDRRTNFYGVWYWRPTDAPSPIDQWRADADSIPLNPVPTDTVSAVAEAELQAALGYAARDIAVGQLFKYGGKYFEKLPNGRFGVIEKFPGTVAVRVSSKLGREASDALRAAARDIWQAATGRRAIWDDLQVHHRIPLEWAHLFPKADPNRLSNLVGINSKAHSEVSKAWNAWKLGLNGRTPSQAELLEQALSVDKLFDGLWVFPK